MKQIRVLKEGVAAAKVSLFKRKSDAVELTLNASDFDFVKQYLLDSQELSHRTASDILIAAFEKSCNFNTAQQKHFGRNVFEVGTSETLSRIFDYIWCKRMQENSKEIMAKGKPVMEFAEIFCQSYDKQISSISNDYGVRDKIINGLRNYAHDIASVADFQKNHLTLDFGDSPTQLLCFHEELITLYERATAEKSDAKLSELLTVALDNWHVWHSNDLNYYGLLYWVGVAIDNSGTAIDRQKLLSLLHVF